MKTLAIGLMSGTSADGVTAALVAFDKKSVDVLRFRTYAYSPSLRKRALNAAALTTPELSLLNFELGEAFARAALAIGKGKRAAVIGSHGQTVWHGPRAKPANTLQLGEAAVIAEKTGLPVVADFRVRDMAAGGQGAPLVPAFDEFLFANGPMRALQNIGGIGNVTLAGRGKVWTAFDTGPGNGLMDLAVRLATHGRRGMDENGRLARAGKADERLVMKMLNHPYFHKRAPKSLDKDDFGEKFLRRHFRSLKKLPDVLATLNLFTACSIAGSCSTFPKLSEVVVAGGGARNPVLMRNLRILLDPVPVVTSAEHGIPVMAKEAACFAWLGLQTWRGKANNCPKATGARGRRILGKIVPA